MGSLIRAIQKKDGMLINKLITDVSCLCERDINECTPLHWVATEGIASLIPKMAPNCNISAKDKWGNTALHVAAVAGDLETVEALVSAGADINLVNDKGDTPYRLAHKERNNDVSSYLKSIGGK